MCLLQLGPNPTSLDGVPLGQGRSGTLSDGGTLYLVNQNHPFKLCFDLKANRAAPSTVKKGDKATNKTQGGSKETPVSSNPKRSIKDFFSTSPMKVKEPECVSLGLMVLLHFLLKSGFF